MSKLKEKILKEIEKKYQDKIKNIKDLTGNKKPSILFYYLANHFDYLLDNDENKLFSEKSMKRREKINKIIKKYGHLFLKSKQVFEDRNELKYNDYQEQKKLGENIELDKGLLEKDKGANLKKKRHIFGL